MLGSIFASAVLGFATPVRFPLFQIPYFGGANFTSIKRYLPLTYSLPVSAKCFNIAYSKCEIDAAGNQDIFQPVGTTQGFPMKYPLANLKYTNGTPFPASGDPWTEGCTDISTPQKYPLVPKPTTGTFPNGTAKPRDGSTTRSSVAGDQLQSGFVFMNAEGHSCMIAAETQGGMPGWLPCEWFIGG